MDASEEARPDGESIGGLRTGMGEAEGEIGIGEGLLVLSRECLPNGTPTIEYALIEESIEGVGERQLTGFASWLGTGCGVRVRLLGCMVGGTVGDPGGTVAETGESVGDTVGWARGTVAGVGAGARGTMGTVAVVVGAARIRCLMRPGGREPGADVGWDTVGGAMQRGESCRWRFAPLISGDLRPHVRHSSTSLVPS